jgi:SAM-dependent methyltransferase
MSDEPIKLAPPEAPPLDDIILGDDEPTLTIPTRGASPALERAGKDNDADAPGTAIEGGGFPDDRDSQRPRERSSNRMKAAEPAKEARKRSKMTLRIPDDEISRPQLPDPRTPMGGFPAIGSTRAPSDSDLEQLRPDRIIAVNRPPWEPSPEDMLELPRSDLDEHGRAMKDGTSRRAPGIDAEEAAGWTPYQPTVADRMDLGSDRVMARGDDVAAVARATWMRDPQRTMIDEPGMDAIAMMRQQDSVPPASEDVPIDTDEDELPRDRFEDDRTHPRLPPDLDSDEIKLEEGERHTDLFDVPEVDADDLVSVESIPPPLKATRGTPSAAPVTATSLMGQTGMASGMPASMPVPLAIPPGASALGPFGSLGVTPVAPAVAARAPSVPAPTPSSHPAPQPPREASPLELQLPDAQIPAAATPMAGRHPAAGPFGFMPPVGALAPPPMSESAANRKKTRPWWEDLFNDDFIRTMAKITDGDIAREANFIEESLGCEAGATILDLACGTGRHAVELAGRGYQVVGFDLSLAMLARASDEAQERKQKINFVQGDMREMTFEETFDGVFSWNTSFGYFEDEKNAAVIAKVHRALKKGGQFLLDVVNRDCVIRQAPSLAWFEGDGCICMDEMQIDFITSRMKVKRTLMMDDGRTKEIEYSIRVYSLHELGKMLHDNGFRVAEVSGGTGTPGVFFGCEAPRTLILAEKR